MGREVRRVPADWQHPRYTKEDAERSALIGRLKPLYPGERYTQRVKEWDEAVASRGLQGAIEWCGNPPNRDDFMPDWPEAERTHLMMYEDTSEGTPISPAFATPEELARWLADNGASAFGNSGASYEQWLATCRGAWAPSMVLTGGRLMSGVEFAATAK